MSKKSDKSKVVKTRKPVVVRVPNPKPDFTPRTKPAVDYAAINAKRVDEAYEQATIDYAAFADGVTGVYGFLSPAGKVIVEVMTNGGEKPVIYVNESSVASIVADDEWFLVHQCLRFESVRQIAGTDLFRWQEALHTFLRPFVADLYKPKAVVVAQEVAPIKVLTEQ